MTLTTMLPKTTLCTCLLFASIGASHSALAEETTEGKWYLKVHTGAGWYSKGKDQTLNYGGGHFDTLKNASDNEIAFQYGLGGGYRIEVSHKQSIELGLGWYGDLEHEYKGFIDQYGSSQFRDHNYKYKIQTQRLVVEGRWNFPLHEMFDGFVTGGVGMSWNKFSNYQNHTLNAENQSPKPQFGENTQSEFAWQLGFGVSWIFIPEWRASLYYLYANNG